MREELNEKGQPRRPMMYVSNLSVTDQARRAGGQATEVRVGALGEPGEECCGISPGVERSLQ